MSNFYSNLLIDDILHFMPHRYPFLLIDKIIFIKKFQNICSLKNVTINEPCFLGHFNENPIFPGVLILESIAQTSGFLIFYSFNRYIHDKRFFFLTGLENVFFKKYVIPGDQMFINVKLIKINYNNFFFKSFVIVNNDVACKSKIICSFKSDLL